ncbi:serine/threonine protein kinase [Fimbriiglobus ruber]|uniref:Serine/threonine protein kinase n=1 Tax=Fimbriiglobus ruber TaxID=1908690 RepID=A0A225DG11_9BACT|nr:serine/threonine-protein kinase [Fimbriiglobus ruber]OWK35027.1 Serine/threonine protein kinase [Fimbriiglobus ruber]
MAIDKIGKFSVLATLGAGAHSSILRIRREADGREYALKLVSVDGNDEKKFLEQAKLEYRVGQMLDHPALVKVYCFETESDWLFRVKKAKLLVEFVPGQTLDKVPLLKMAKLLRVLEKAAAGLVHMHKAGVVHADLKPNNMMLGRGTNVKILDYGLSWIKGEPKDRVQGTPEYMAPETVQHKIINERTDIYNFGATMYRLVTFKLPPPVLPGIEGMGPDEKMFTSQLKPVQSLNPIAPKELSALIHSCLNFNAHKRPERMSQVQSVLDRLAEAYEAKLSPAELEEE